MWKWLSLDNQSVYIDGEKRNFIGAHDFTQYIITKKSKSIYINSATTTTSNHLVYFIDLSDYPKENRPCCNQHNQVCSKCWLLLVAAMVVIKHKLETVFGLDDVTFFYNGSTGIYCFVDIKNKTMSAVIDSSIQLIHANELNKGFKHLTDDRNKSHLYLSKENMPETLFYEWQLLELLFKEYCVSFGLYTGKKGYIDLIDCCTWNKFENSRLKSMYIHTPIKDRPQEDEPAWSLFKRNVNQVIRDSGYRASHALKTCCYALVFYFMYPRVHICHTSKMFSLVPFPFSINKETGKLVVPVVPSIDQFQVETVPTLSSVTTNSKTNDWKTSDICNYIVNLQRQ
jgi:DNA primase small subunit